MNRRYRNRIDAAEQLAGALEAYRGTRPLVVAIPRGAVPMGERIAQRLDGELDVVLVRKIGAPGWEEVAIGAVDESGWMHVADSARAVGADNAYLEREKARQLETMRARRARYTPGRTPIDPGGRNVIVVDDGLATGETMLAALHSLRGKAPARLICAVPVAARDSLARVAVLADEVVCPLASDDFQAVSAYYDDFAQVSDEEVVATLEAARTRQPGTGKADR